MLKFLKYLSNYAYKTMFDKYKGIFMYNANKNTCFLYKKR